MREGGDADVTNNRQASEIGCAQSGYNLRLCCTCGQHYLVFVTPEIAAEDFLTQAERN